MSSGSGISDQIIALPEGGGAVHGIGETFAPDLHTGTGNFTVPLAIPAGRNGFGPGLRLSYSTGNGNGPFGLGWTLTVPGVSRKTSKGIPIYDDQMDTFVLSGAEDLVKVESSGPVTSYRPRTEGMFARIEHHRTNLDNYWQVVTRDGLISFYGTRRPPGAPADWQDPATITSPDNPAKVAAWRLSETRDPFGNRILYDYVRDAGPTAARRWNQLYLKRVRYVDYAGAGGLEQFLVSVEFTYQDRPDPFSDYRSAFEIRTARRCKRIDIVTHADTDRLLKTYELIYIDEREDLPAPALPPNKTSLLSQVRVSGHDGDQKEDLPPLEFGYTVFEPEKRTFSALSGSDLPAVSLANQNYELADLFGKSLPDIFEMDDTVRYWRNLGGGHFDLPREMRNAPSGLQLAEPGVQLLDADGDGRVDLLVSTETHSGYFPLRFDGEWDRRSFRRYQQAPTFNLEDPEVKLVDLNGDGVPDAIRSSERFEIFFNDPQKGWGKTRRVERRPLEEFPNVSFSDPRVKWGDMSGDGLQDILLVYDGLIVYWPNLGYGNWGRAIFMRNSPRFPEGYDPARILVGDVDGDGAADLVYVDDTRVTLWINQAGNGWSDPLVITGTPAVSDADAVRLADMLGSGVSGVLWSSEFTGLSRQTMFFLDFTGGVKPYLLDEMDNNLGGLTSVQYVSSSQFYIEDQAKPETRWKTHLPFPVQVVSRVEVIDQFSRGKLTTEYKYHHGHWDGAEREFRGFGLVEQFDSEVFEVYNQPGLHGSDTPFINVTDQPHFSPPTYTKTWFHLGPVGDESGDWEELDFSSGFWPDDLKLLQHKQGIDAFLRTLPTRRARRDALRALRGSVLRNEFYAADGTAMAGRPYTVTERAYGLRLEQPPSSADAHAIFFPHLVAQRTTQWERGNDPLTQFEFTETGDYDAFGQILRGTQIACPRGWRTMQDKPGQPYLATRIQTRYAQPLDPGTYIVNRAARVTSFELKNDGTLPVLDLRNLTDDDPSASVTGQAYRFYDGPGFLGLPLGQVGPFGALVRSETLAFTESLLHDAYKSGGALTNPPEEPPYLASAGTPPWTPEYVPEFRGLVPPLGGYVFHQGGPDAGDVRGFFTPTERYEYDFQGAGAGGTGRGLPTVLRDPLGHNTSVVYDQFGLLPVRVTAARLITTVEYDYRVLQAKHITEVNGNTSLFTFTPLGLLKETFIRGKNGEGDQHSPSLSLTYGFLNFLNSKQNDPQNPQPTFVHTTRRTHHDSETDIPLPGRDETIETREYSDGFGRLLQTRSQAEDTTFGDAVFGAEVIPADQNDQAGTARDVIGRQRGPAGPTPVVVSGWQFYDNKGRVVRKYEPFFSAGFDYKAPGDAELGQKAEMFYDPRGFLIRSVYADNSEERVIFGVPGTMAAPDLGNPDVYEPTPWEAYTYDTNDNAGRTHPGAAASYRHHWDTPGSVVVDALGRTIITTERNRNPPSIPGGPLPPIEELTSRSTYDIRGNVLNMTDALNRVAFTHIYDFANRPLRIESIDAGIRRTIPGGAGTTIEYRDSKGTLILRGYDDLNRATHLWARDAAGEAVTLRERMIYGDDPASGLTGGQVAAGNLAGNLYRHYDEAGRLSLTQYDFKANLVEKERRVISAQQIITVFAGPPPNWNIKAYRVDWAPSGDSSPRALEKRASTVLDAKTYQMSSAFDALNRAKSLRYPADVGGGRKLLLPRYNRAGNLEHVALDGAIYVDRIAYSAKGQRLLVAYGNGVMTRYAYDARTFRLARLRTESFTQPTPLTYRPSLTVRQDYAYEYDLAGNILHLHDRAPGSGVPNTPLGTEALDRDFAFDAVYRLLSASGRECDRPPQLPWGNAPRCADVTRARTYTEAYRYDAADNILQLQHGVNRNFTLAPGSNRLDSVAIGQNTYGYAFDPSGNMIRETTSRHFEWDHADRMRVFRTQVDGAEPSTYAHYLYDSGSRRVMKLVRKQGGQVEITVSIDGLFEQQQIGRGRARQENNTLHVMENQNRVAVVRAGRPFPKDASPAVKRHYGDHLGSSTVVLGGPDAASSAFINREEYTPYGETSFGSFELKRYRFSGKERDEESGLYQMGIRACAPWLGRWITCDPAGPVDGLNLFTAFLNNPLSYRDPSGTQGEDAAALTGAASGGASDIAVAPPDGFTYRPDLSTMESTGGDPVTISVTEVYEAPATAQPSAGGDAASPASDQVDLPAIGAGLAYGARKALTPLGFAAPPAAPLTRSPREFGLGEGAGEVAVGVIEYYAGHQIFEFGARTTLGGLAAEGPSGTTSTAAVVAGAGVAVAGAYVAASGAANIAGGISNIWHAMASGGTKTRTPAGSEKLAEEGFAGTGARQESFMQGHRRKWGTKGSTRPDIYSDELNLSVEVKNYDLSTPAGRRRLVSNVVGQANRRAPNLPAGAKQALVLDVGGQNISDTVLEQVIKDITAGTPHFGDRWWIFVD